MKTMNNNIKIKVGQLVSHAKADNSLGFVSETRKIESQTYLFNEACVYWFSWPQDLAPWAGNDYWISADFLRIVSDLD